MTTTTKVTKNGHEDLEHFMAFVTFVAGFVAFVIVIAVHVA